MVNHKEKLKELRAAIPVPMGEALQLLKENEGDVQKCKEIIIEQNVAIICSETGCEKDEAKAEYENEKYDVNRAISLIREKIYDRNYSPIEGLSKEGIRTVMDWMHTVDSYDFISALSYPKIDDVINTLNRIPLLAEASAIVSTAKATRDVILANEEHMTNEEFIKQNTILDVHPHCIDGTQYYIQKKTIITDELVRHLRNLV